MENRDYSISSKDLMMQDGFCGNTYLHLLHDQLSDRRKHLRFQVDCNGYFATLATIINLIADDDEAFKTKRYRKFLKRISDDLMYLHNNYEIVPK